MKDNPVAKNAHKFNKASVQKDRKKALKKGDRKHKGRYEDSGDIEERSTLDVISSVLNRGKDKSKYQAAVKAVKSGKYTLSKAAQVFGVRDKVLQDLVAEGNMKENGKGLWANIRAKRARGERPAKKGEKGYPKTLDIESTEESTDKYAKSQSNIRRKDKHSKISASDKAKLGKLADLMKKEDDDPCWDTHKKVGTKMKNGKRVNDCVPKNESSVKGKMGSDEYLKSVGKGQDRNQKDTLAALQAIRKKKTQKEDNIDELSSKTLSNYVRKASDARGHKKLSTAKQDKRYSGVARAGRKLDKKLESVDEAAAPKFTFAVYNKDGKLHGATTSEKEAKSMAFRIKGKFKKLDKPMKQTDIDKKMAMNEGSMELAMPDYPEQDKMKVKFAKKEDTMSRARETKRLKDKHASEREQERAAAKRVTSSTTSTGNRSVSVTRTRSEQIIAKHTDENLVEELSTLEKRKYMNLKKRAKSGDRTAKKQLDAFEKANADAIKMGKGSAAKSKKGNATKKGAADPHSGAGYSGKASEKGSDDHIIMQLRKAQDVKGNMDIKVTPTGKTVRVPLSLINKVLDRHDRMTKPDEKRKLRVLLTKELRKKAK